LGIAGELLGEEFQYDETTEADVLGLYTTPMPSAELSRTR